jgi:hypothetical protein
MVEITTDSEINLPENPTISEKFILWLVARNNNTRSPKIGFTQKYFTDKNLKFPKVRSSVNLQKQSC